MSVASDRGRGLLTAAFGFLRLPPRTALRALHAWLDSWSGIGHIVLGMERYGYRVSIKKYGNGDGAWAAQFNRDVANVGGRLRQRLDAVDGRARGGVAGDEGRRLTILATPTPGDPRRGS